MADAIVASSFCRWAARSTTVGRRRFLHASGADLHRAVDRRLPPLVPERALLRGEVELDVKVGQTPGEPGGALGASIAVPVVVGPAVVLVLGAFARRGLGESDLAAHGEKDREQDDRDNKSHGSPQIAGVRQSYTRPAPQRIPAPELGAPRAICGAPASAREMTAQGGPQWLCRDHLPERPARCWT